MANTSKSSLGSILGVALAVVLVGGIAATPFYLSKFEPTDRALTAASSRDVETIRRVVLDLDQQLGAISDMDAALPPADRLSKETAEQIKAAHSDVFGEELARRLNQTAQLLKDAQKSDESRGIALANASSVSSTPLSPGTVVEQMRKEYLGRNDGLRKQAKDAIDKLKQLSIGEGNAGSVLAVNRIEATFYYVVGRIHCNRAEFRQEQASSWRRAAVQKLGSVASIRRDIAALEAQTPTQALANVQGLLKQVDEKITAAEQEVSGLQPQITKLKRDLAKAEKTLAEANQQMREIEAGDRQMRSSDEAARYIELATKAREAEARVLALQNGTLVGAEAVPVTTDDGGTSIKYEGGKAEKGLRDLQFELERYEEQLKTWQANRSDLQKQDEAFKSQIKKLEEERSTAAATADKYSTEVRELLSKAEECSKDARKARSDAQQAFSQAQGLCQASIRNASSRTKGAAEKVRASSGGTPNACLELISKDADTEASMLCLAADIAFNIAATNAGEIEELKDQSATQSLVSKLGGGEAPADAKDQIEKLRTEAANKLAEAAKSLEAAEKLVAGVNVKSGSVNIVGSNYVWQVQVGQAAVHLMRASLAALVDGTPDQKEQDQAYELLTKLAQGREQSPLISSAIDTIQYLQQTAK